MQGQVVGKPAKCLFVISHDFGELGFAYSLLTGSQFAADACILLPPHLYELNKNSLPCASRCYRNFDDIRTESKDYSPDLVFLLSGSLFWQNKIGSLNAIRRWLSGLRAEGCGIITSDPFLGIAASFKPRDFSPDALWSRPVHSLPGKLLKFLVVKAKQIYVTIQFRRSHATFSSAEHIFAMPVDHLKSFRKVRYVCFWNPALLEKQVQGSSEQKRLCLFVLSQLDYQIQSLDLGHAEFLDLMAEKMNQVKELDRHPVLLGPSDLVAQLATRLPEEFHSSLRSNISYAKFQELLINAEHVFYWNMISHSMYTRLILGKPFHLFARGHLSHIVPRWHKRAIRTYYFGTEPALIDMTDPLEFESLERQASAFRKRTAGLLEQMRHFRSPDSLVKKLLEH